MDLKGILSVSGYGGLFKLIKQSKAGFIVESLIDNKRMQAFATTKISTLEEIAIFTETSEVHLKDVLRSIFKIEDGKQVNLNPKSSGEEYKAYFEKILPDYDRERVYVSDMKKVITWYNLLVEKGMVDLEEDKPEEVLPENEQKEKEVEKAEEPAKTPVKESKPKKKPVKKVTKKDED
jgi:hypothetical protein